LLEEAASSIKTKPQTVLALLSTVNFYAQWNSEFQEEATEEGAFTNADGTITTCDFLHQTMSRTYVAGEKFAAVSLPFENGAGSMLLVLPDEGYTPEELLAEEETMAVLQRGVNALEEKSVFVEVDLSLPKFDVNSDLDLEDSLKRMGVVNAFSETDANFAPLVTEEFTDPIFLSQANHAARVSIDEKGCTAASYVVMMMEAGAAMPTERVELKIDHPFLFVISGVDGLPLFAGIVNRL